MEEKENLINAIKNKQNSLINKLINKEENINAKDEHGKTPLMYAAEQGDKKTVGKLIKLGADIEAESNSGQTASGLAALQGYKKMAEMLKPDSERNKKYRKYFQKTASGEYVFNMNISLLPFFIIGILTGIIIYIKMKYKGITILYPFFMTIMLAYIYEILRKVLTKFIINETGASKRIKISGVYKAVKWENVREIVLENYKSIILSTDKQRLIIYGNSGDSIKFPGEIKDFEKLVNLVKREHSVRVI